MTTADMQLLTRGEHYALNHCVPHTPSRQCAISYLCPIWAKAAEVVKVGQRIRVMHYGPVSFSSVNPQTQIIGGWTQGHN